MATIQHLVLDKVVKVTLDRSQEVTTTYVTVVGHGTDTSSESDTSTPEAENTTNSESKVQVPVCLDEGQVQDIVVHHVSTPLQSQGQTEGQVESQTTVYEQCELQGQNQGHDLGDAQGHLDDFEWVDADVVIEEKSLLNDVMSALEEGGFTKNVFMTGGIGQDKGVATLAEDSKCLENVYKGVVSVQPRAGSDSLTRTEELTLTPATRGTCGIHTGRGIAETHGNATETLAGNHVSTETIPVNNFDDVKPSVNNDVTEECAASQPSPREPNDKKEHEQHQAETNETEDSKRHRNAQDSVETRPERATGRQDGPSGSIPEVNLNSKPRPNEKKIIRKIIDVKFVIEREKSPSGTVLGEAGQFSFTSLGPRMDSPEPPGPEKDNPVPVIDVRGKGNPTEDRARDTESGDDYDTPDCTRRTASGDGKAPVNSLKRKLLCCSVN